MNHVSETVKSLRDRIARLRSELNIEETTVKANEFREAPQVTVETVSTTQPQKVSKDDLRAKLSGIKKNG